MLKHFQKNAANVAVPVGSSALEENTCRTSGRMGAKSYMLMKPIKFGIRFYAVVNSHEIYCSSLSDNGTGNHTGTTHAGRYLEAFWELRLPFKKCFQGNKKGMVSGVAKDRASALWTLQMAHQTRKQADPNDKCVFFMDNFYTHHILGEKLKTMTDNKARITGTVKLNLVNKVNSYSVKKAMELLADKPCSTWAYARAYDNEPESKATGSKRKRKGTGGNAPKKCKTTKSKSEKVAEAPKEPTKNIKNAGYVLYKDSKVVIFYSHDLDGTFPKWYGLGTNDAQAIHCVHGLAPLHCWTERL